MYVVVAIAVGFLLISAVPSQLSMLAQPASRLSEDTLGSERAPAPEGEPSIQMNDTLGGLESWKGESDQANLTVEEVSSALGGVIPVTFLYFLLDLVVAIAVYMAARRLLT